MNRCLSSGGEEEGMSFRDLVKEELTGYGNCLE